MLHGLLTVGSLDRHLSEKQGYGLPLAAPTIARDTQDTPMIVYSYVKEIYSEPMVIFYDIMSEKDIVKITSAHMFVGFPKFQPKSERSIEVLLYVDLLLYDVSL